MHSVPHANPRLQFRPVLLQIEADMRAPVLLHNGMTCGLAATTRRSTGEDHMGTLRCFKSAFVFAAILLLLGAAPAFAQETTPPAAAKVAPYNVQQTVEVGFRYTNLGGNMSNYDTFENLNSGARLLDYSLEVTSPDHKGKFFDNISLYNFGYGGDPNDLTHLRVTKSRRSEERR